MKVKEELQKKRSLVICGHPDSESFGVVIAKTLTERIQKAEGEEAELVLVSELKFNPNLQFGYRKRTELEPDLLDLIKKIKAVDHLIWVFPTWWGAMPAMMKGLIDRVFLPGFFFKYQDGKATPEKLLKGKTAELIVTTDTPWFLIRFLGVSGQGIKIMKKSVLGFCGVKVKKVKILGVIKKSTLEQREKWLRELR